jgi:hypothetical protein
VRPGRRRARRHHPERDTIWLGDLHEAQLVRAVAHEIGHIAELLGYVPEGDGVEAFPRQLANAVGATYTAGIGWVDRLLDSSFYLRALSEGRCGSDLKGGWGRGAYWSRLARTRGTYVRSDAPPPAVAALGGPALPAVEEVGVEARVDPVEGAVRPARLIAVPFNRPPGTGRR